jgi:hypothetical protein
MRLIDADALIAQWESDAEEMEEFAIKLATYGAINDVKRQPTIEPRKKGKWIDNETSYADGVRQSCNCSVCGKRSIRPLGDFCRWCGANMREGGEQ